MVLSRWRAGSRGSLKKKNSSPFAQVLSLVILFNKSHIIFHVSSFPELQTSINSRLGAGRMLERIQEGQDLDHGCTSMCTHSRDERGEEEKLGCA